MLKPCRIMLMLALLLGQGAASTSPAMAAPKRIVSLNLCADQLLIALADTNRIAALSPFARDPSLSFHAREARSLPQSRGSLEEVLALRPDLILAPPPRVRTKVEELGGDAAIIDIPPAAGLDGIIANIRTVAGAVGHRDRGERIIARMEADVARLEAVGAGAGRVAAYYQRRGYLTGGGTLADELMAKAGLVNLASKLGRPALSRLSLEEMIAARPDFLIMDSDARTIADRGTELLHHPALQKIVPPSHRIYLEQSLTVCGGPFYTQALIGLIRQIRAAGR